MKDFITLLTFAPEIRKLVIEIGRLLQIGDNQTALERFKAYQTGTASGKAAWEASKSAGHEKRSP